MTNDITEVTLKSELLGLEELATIEIPPSEIRLAKEIVGSGGKVERKMMQSSDRMAIGFPQPKINYDPAPGNESTSETTPTKLSEQKTSPTWETLPVQKSGAIEPPVPENMTSVGTSTLDGTDVNTLKTGWSNGGSILVANVPIGLFTRVMTHLELTADCKHVAMGIGDSAHNEYWGIRQTTDSDGNDAWEFYTKSQILNEEATAKDYIAEETTTTSEILTYDPTSNITMINAMCSAAFCNIEYEETDFQNSKENIGGGRMKIPRDIYSDMSRPDTAYNDPSIQFLVEPVENPGDNWKPTFYPVQYGSNLVNLKQSGGNVA